MKKLFLVSVIAMLFIEVCCAQNIGIGTTAPDASSILEIKASTKGLLIPRTSTVSRTAIVNPAKGLMVYDTTTNSFWYHNGIAWTQVGAAGTGWSLTGNAGTNASVNYIGTTDAQPLIFKIKNVQSGIIDSVTQNTSIGFRTLDSVTSGTGNTAFGYEALKLSTIGEGNTANGAYALFDNTTGGGNTAIGSSALYNNTTGNTNTATGEGSLYSNSTGNGNTANGTDNLFSNTTGDANTASGYRALSANTTGSDNTANGEAALNSNTVGTNNTASGMDALIMNTSGENNTANGMSSLYSNTTGINNTADGENALYGNTTGSGNIAIGQVALFSNTIGYANNAIGENTMYKNVSGYNNVANGNSVLFSNTSGFGNTANGTSALYFNTIGTGNTADGFNSLQTNATGNNNTVLGVNADVTTDGLTNATAIGANAQVSTSNSIVLGSSANVGIGTSAPQANLHVNVSGTSGYAGIMISSSLSGGKPITINQGSAGKLNFTLPGVIDLVTMNFNNNTFGINETNPTHLLQLGNDDAFKPGTSTWGVLSDGRVKEDIDSFTDGLNVVLQMKPIWFNYNGLGGTPKGKREIGTVAQELQQVAPYMVSEVKSSGTEDPGATYLAVNYHALFFVLVNAMKEQNKKIDLQQQQINTLLNDMEQLKQKINAPVK